MIFFTAVLSVGIAFLIQNHNNRVLSTQIEQCGSELKDVGGQIKDVVGLAEGGWLSFQPVPTPSPGAPAVPVHRQERIRKREEARQRTLANKKAEAAQKTQEVLKVRKPSPTGTPPPEQARSEVAAVMDLRMLRTCPVPVHAVVNREIDRDGHREHWVLLDTAAIPEPLTTREDIGCARALKSDIEN